VLLAFLTTSCSVCGPFWQALAHDDLVAGYGARLVVVTPSPALEDRAAAEALVPAGVRLHMSSSTWFAYGVGQAGTFVLAAWAPGAPPPWEEPGRALGHASITSPGELRGLLARWFAQGDRPGTTSQA
jgi:hypothetical protein